MRARSFSKGKVALLVLLAAAGGMSFENLKASRDLLHSFVETHYALSATVFIAVVFSTAFFVPGAIALTLIGGFLFGVLQGTVFLLVGATLGSALAFLFARYILGNWIQHRYEEPLRNLNEEIKRHGHHYLAALRIVPIMPFFLVNYLAGITKMSLRTFIWTTAAGMLPGTLIYTFAGRELARIESPEDVLSPRLLAALILLAVFVLLPVIMRVVRRVGAY
jgi:uncharacterized membrane protein YdjX (TVP38/TMEM64 family)